MFFWMNGNWANASYSHDKLFLSVINYYEPMEESPEWSSQKSDLDC